MSTNDQSSSSDAREIARLREALRTFGQHHGRCAKFKYDWEGRRPSGEPCDCGLTAALADPSSSACSMNTEEQDKDRS